MVQIYWRDMYCPRCERQTKHRSSIKGNVSVTVDEKSKLTVPRLLSQFNNPDADWTCWTCKSTGVTSMRKYDSIEDEPTDAFLTVYPRDKKPETEDQKRDFMLDQLATVLGVLEDRIASIEKMLLGKESPRMIRVRRRK